MGLLDQETRAERRERAARRLAWIHKRRRRAARVQELPIAEEELRAEVSRRLAALENREGKLWGATVRVRELEALARDGSAWRRQFEGLAGQPIAGSPPLPAPPAMLELELERDLERLRSHRTGNVSAPDWEAQLASYQGRRRDRWRLRETAQALSHHKRLISCGHIATTGGVGIVQGESGTAHFDGVRHCGRLWICPVCAARIAYGRSLELTQLLRLHAAAGGGCLFATMTIPHEWGDALKASRSLVSDLWRTALQGRAWIDARQEYGIVGMVRALEATHGANGWHPHVHALILTERELELEEANDFRATFARQWIRACIRKTGRAPLLEHQVIERAHSAATLAEYVAKIQRAAAGDTTGGRASRELTRWDVKGGARTVDRPGRSPFGILADIRAARILERRIRAELALPARASRRHALERRLEELRAALAGDRRLWREWEEGMRGAKQLTWTRGLRKRYAVNEATDEELANAPVGGERIVTLSAELWHLVRLERALPMRILEAAERGGAGAVGELLEATLERWRGRGVAVPRGAHFSLAPLPVRRGA